MVASLGPTPRPPSFVTSGLTCSRTSCPF
jgi:hypothetical protein